MKKKIMSVLIAAVMVLSITACSSKDEPQTPESIEEEETTVEEPDQEIGKDFDADVRAGLLWINEQGQVTDKDGNVIDAYSYIIANDRKTLLSENDIMAGYTMTDDMQIIIDEEYITMTEEDSIGDDSYADTLLSIADPSVEGQKASLTEPNYILETSADIVDNRETYYSDIIYGNWWEDGVNGTPITYSADVYITFLPDKISHSIDDSDIAALTQLHKFKFIDQNTFTVEELKRSTPDNSLYAFYLQNVQKNQDEGGVYFTGYIDTEFVAVYGNYSNLMNGDNVFVYAAYNGLSIDDVPVFDSGYIEFIQ